MNVGDLVIIKPTYDGDPNGGEVALLLEVDEEYQAFGYTSIPLYRVAITEKVHEWYSEEYLQPARS
jgi:hypothetical protein